MQRACYGFSVAHVFLGGFQPVQEPVVHQGHPVKVLVTGANGFVGKPLCDALRARAHAVQSLPHQRTNTAEGARRDVYSTTEINDALQETDVVVHLAARVHATGGKLANPPAEYRRVNLGGTEQLAIAAVRAGVKRFVFISTVKVHGEAGDAHIREGDASVLQDAYSASKWEAEQALANIAKGTGLEVVILRPPLVYGPGVKANFLALLRAVDGGLPLPLGGIHNYRSLIYLGNLVDAIMVCVEHPAAAGKTYLVSDGDDVSTPEIVRRLAAALGKPARLFPFPPALMKFSATLLGRGAAVDRLLSSLRVDSSKIREELGWAPPYTMQQGLRETADWYRHRSVL
ncbi:MAG: SDR family oxidoreductase [Burkholderiales bacterium]|nr:SDR family oxidoreductase [Burkholderiales bacterium]